MVLDGRELTLSVNQSFPSAGEVTSPGGGSWAAGTFAFKVVAQYRSGEGFEDNAGVIRANVALWVHTVDTNDKVIITWTASERVPDHYSIYYIEAGGWVADGVLRGRKIAQVQGDVLTATILVPWTQQGASTQLTGNATSTGSSTILHDTTANWDTDGTKVGDSIGNTSDGSTATIVTINPNGIELTTTALTGGGLNIWLSGHEWKLVSTTMLVDDAANFISNGVAVGDYVIMKITGDFAKITSVNSETKLQTQALTNGDSYAITEAYDVVDNIFIISTFANGIVVNPIKDYDPEIRETMVRAYNGRLVAKSYALDSPLNGITIVLYTNTSINEDNLHTILKWIAFGVRIRITESSGANALISPIDGYFKQVDHMGSRYKSTHNTITLGFAAELGTVT